MGTHHTNRIAKKGCAPEPTAVWLRCLFRVWCGEVRHRHVHMLVQHPHNYTTAAGLTAFFFLIGYVETGLIAGLWAFALIDNVTSINHS